MPRFAWGLAAAGNINDGLLRSNSGHTFDVSKQRIQFEQARIRFILRIQWLSGSIQTTEIDLNEDLILTGNQILHETSGALEGV